MHMTFVIGNDGMLGCRIFGKIAQSTLYIILSAQQTKTDTCANSVDPDEMAR